MKKIITIRPNGSRRIQYESDLPTKTQQSFKESCDVNKIVNKFNQTGLVSHLNRQNPSYGDFSGLTDFKTNLDTVSQAMQAFNALPSHIRKRFSNNPALLADFVMDSSNYDEALKLGLVVPKAAPKTESTLNDSNDGATSTPAAT